MRVVCAWCRTVIVKGDGETSHGICQACAAKLEEPDMTEEIARLRTDLAAAQNVKALLAEEIQALKEKRDECEADLLWSQARGTDELPEVDPSTGKIRTYTDEEVLAYLRQQRRYERERADTAERERDELKQLLDGPAGGAKREVTVGGMRFVHVGVLRKAERERDNAQETSRRLHRRCQSAESGVRAATKGVGTRDFGRILANAGFVEATARAENLKQERDEARATKDLHKERQQQEIVRAEKAEAANAVMADALRDVQTQVGPTREIFSRRAGRTFDGAYEATSQALRIVDKALAHLTPATVRIQEIVKAAERDLARCMHPPSRHTLDCAAEKCRHFYTCEAVRAKGESR